MWRPDCHSGDMQNSQDMSALMIIERHDSQTDNKVEEYGLSYSRTTHSLLRHTPRAKIDELWRVPGSVVEG